MVQLRLPNKALQLAVFNVLKVFIPNPFKADSIIRILTANKKNFLAFLNDFERDSSHTHAHTCRHRHTVSPLPPMSPLADAVLRVPVCAARADDTVLISHKREMIDAFHHLEDAPPSRANSSATTTTP